MSTTRRSPAAVQRARVMVPLTQQQTQLIPEPVGASGARPPRQSSAKPRSAKQATSEAAHENGPSIAPTAGSLISIGGNDFEVLFELGHGSYGVVWDAICTSSGYEGGSRPSVAIKWSSMADDEKWQDGVFEAAVLKQVSEALPEKPDAMDHFPRYIAHCARRPRHTASTQQGRSGQSASRGTVSIAMHKVPGKPLDQWLYGFDEHRLKHVSMTEIFETSETGGNVGSRNLVGAEQAATALLSQMAPVFETLSRVAFHRDVSAHNIMVETRQDNKFNFSLIDFGLAVSSHRWCDEYRTRNLAGTPHYFPPTTWMIFAYGHKYLEKHPDEGLVRQYRERLDHFAMGMLTLELFFGVWDGTCSAFEAPGRTSEASSHSAPKELRAARSAWRAYWGKAIVFYQRFHGRGVSGFRKELMSSQAVSQLQGAVQTLQKALRLAANAYEFRRFALILAVAADLIDAHGTISWSEISDAFQMQDGPEGEEQLRPGRKGSFLGDLPDLPQKRHVHRRVWSADGANGRTEAEVHVLCKESPQAAPEEAPVRKESLLGELPELQTRRSAARRMRSSDGARSTAQRALDSPQQSSRAEVRQATRGKGAQRAASPGP